MISLIETQQIVRHKCLSLQKVSFSPYDQGSLKVLAFHCHFPAKSRFLFCGKNLAINQSWKQPLLVLSFYIRHICHTLLELSHKMSQNNDWDVPCLFLNVAQPASKRLHEAQFENSRKDFHEIRWRIQQKIWRKRGHKISQALD